MSSKREEERNEKIIRGLLKLPPNRKCINCNSLGPQYVCTNFWTFVCMTCSGIHREFTHRVKSVSMAKFTKQEVEALQQGGNQRARETYLKDWDMQGMRLPDSSNTDKIRKFIKDVYVNKKYSEGNSLEKPPRDMEGLKVHEDQRRASSYHSFSQSPPYDQQYEDRRYGKQSAMLSRKPGSDRVIYEGKAANFMHSPGHVQAQMYEDRFANESSGSRMSDFSVSSAGDTFKYDLQSPSSQGTGYSSPSYQPRDIMVEDGRPQIANKFTEPNVRNLEGIPRPKRTASSGSFGSSDGNLVSHRSVDPGGPVDSISEPGHSTRQQVAPSMIPSSVQLAPSKQSQNQFDQPVTSSINASSPSLDLFADFNQQTSSTNVFEQKPSSSVHTVKQDHFSVPLVQPQSTTAPTLDLFAHLGNQSSSTSSIEQKPLAFPPQKTSSNLIPPLDLFANFDNKPSSTSFPPQQTQVQNVASPPLNLFPDIGSQPLSTSFQKPVGVPAQQNEGWATFDLPQYVGGQPATNAGKSNVFPSTGEAPGVNIVGVASHESNQEWLSVHNSVAPRNVPQPSSQWLTDLNGYISAGKISSEIWNAFDASNVKVPPTSFIDPTENKISQVPALYPDTSAYSIPVAAPRGSHIPPSFPALANGAIQVQKSMNPFDLPYEDMEPNKAFDMGSLGAVLPNSQITNDYLAGLPQPWHPQNPGLFVSSMPEGGGLQYMAEQPPNSQFPNIPPHGPVAPLGGNPFA